MILSDGARRMIRRLAIALVAAGALASTATGSALAAKGVAIDLGRVTINEPLRPGERFELPRFRVMNPGDEAADYVMGLGALADTGRAAADPGWLTFSPATFRLEPGSSQVVTAALVVAAGAEPGAYSGLIRAQLAAEGSGSLVGGAAAAHLDFEVVDGAGIIAEGSIDEGIDGAGVIPIGALLAVAGLVAIVVIGRRYRITIGRR